MINRIIIRIKVLQVVYAYKQQNSKNIVSAENELMRGLEQSYHLYLNLLYLIVVLTDFEQRRLDAQKHKYLPTEEQLNPNTRLAGNRFAEQLRLNDELSSFINSKGNFWNDDEQLMARDLLNEVLKSDAYTEYLTKEDSYAADKSFWQKAMKQVLLKNEHLEEYVCNNNLYIDDELDLVGSFVQKTIKQFKEEKGSKQELLPMFKDEEDRTFAIRLLHKSIMTEEENSELIDKQIKNWELDRIALTDLYIMQIALAELKSFPSIPIHVTLNEYIELARYYSTPQSARFINGILDSIVKELKSEGVLLKS